MLRRIAVMFAAFAMLFGVLTSIGAAAQSNGTSISNLLGTQAAIYAGGQPGTLASGMIAVQWPTQVMLDGRLQILSPDYRVLTLSAGDFVISGGQIYSDPTALLAAGYPQELVPTARHIVFGRTAHAWIGGDIAVATRDGYARRRPTVSGSIAGSS